MKKLRHTENKSVPKVAQPGCELGSALRLSGPEYDLDTFISHLALGGEWNVYEDPSQIIFCTSDIRQILEI